MAQTQPEATQLAVGQSGKSAQERNPADPKGNAAGPKGNPTSPENGPGTSLETGAIDMLSADHRHVEQLFSSFEEATDEEQKSQLAAEICTELMVHTLIEEEIFIRPAAVTWKTGCWKKPKLSTTARRR